MTESFNDYTVINNFSILLDGKFNELPHGDTVNNYLKEVDVDQMRDILTFMVKDLIYSRVLDDYRIDGKYYKVIIDAT